MEVERLRDLMRLWSRIRSTRVSLVSRAVLVIKVSDSRVLQIVARSLFLAIVIVTLPMIMPTIRAVSRVTEFELNQGTNGIHLEALPVVIHELADQGHLKDGDKALVLSRGEVELGGLDGHEVEIVMEDDFVCQDKIGDNVFDFVYASSLENGAFIDRVTKSGGLLVSALTDYQSTDLFLGEFDYKIVYVRQFGSTILGMKKLSSYPKYKTPSFKNRRLLGLTSDVKKVALKGLEDVMLEPPTQAKPKSLKNMSKNFKYLPDLLGDSLRGYRRRMFINVGSQDEKKRSLKWFQKNYPTRNQENDFVVMKAEAEVVEEMIESKAMHLIDELFLECKNQWQDSDDKNKNKRAYWECLTLYGRLNDAGVAVHQCVTIYEMDEALAGSGGKVGLGKDGCVGSVGFVTVGIGGSGGSVGLEYERLGSGLYRRLELAGICRLLNGS
ncbi:hypothetical protein QQ045_009029 [Rhodiola kirilowii]